MYCEKCGSRVYSGYCGECGAEVPDDCEAGDEPDACDEDA